MLLQEFHAQVKRMRRMAQEAAIVPEKAATMIQPFIDKYKALRLPMHSNGPCGKPHPRHGEIAAAIQQAGLSVQRRHLKGLAFHSGYQQALARQAEHFGYRGFVECGAIYLTIADQENSVWGRVDVASASGREPEVIFEIDSTIKPASLLKLQQARVPHKYWIYFGKDVWRFKTFLKKHDPAGEVAGIVLPRAWKPVSQ